MPVDLTTLGAGVSLPPPDHPIFNGYVFEETLDTDPEKMAFDIRLLKMRVDALEAEKWTQQKAPLWKRLQTWLLRKKPAQ